MARHAFPGFPAISAAAIAICIALAGCAAIPSGVALQAGNGAGTQGEAYVLPDPPPPPTAAWSASEVVLGFLHASASYAVDPSAARAYLVPSLRKTWPSGRAVTVVGHLDVHQLHVVQEVPQQDQKSDSVSFASQKLATLSQSGQYLYNSGPPTSFGFGLLHVNGVWLINGLPPKQLLLLQSDFQWVFQPRNLYFFARQSPFPELVPDPVYAPIEGSDTALNTTVAKALVQGLFKDKGSWLSPATSSAFPATTVLKSLSIINQTAVVNLGRCGCRNNSQQLQAMDEQLKATLTTPSAYSNSPPVARSVHLEINGWTPYLGVSPDLVRDVSNGQPVVFQNVAGGVTELSAKLRTPGLQVLSPSQIGEDKITAIAAQPGDGSQLAVAVQVGDQCTVYVGRAGARSAYRPYRLPVGGGPCTSLSWDINGRIWAAAARGIWVVRPGSRTAAISRVSLPNIPGTTGANYRILSLHMAPDGVRAALLIQQLPSGHRGARSPSGTRSVLLAAVRDGAVPAFGPAVTAGTGLPDLRSITWFNAYDLAALAGNWVYLIPLTGGASVLRGSAPMQAQFLTTDNAEFIVGTQSQIIKSPTSALSWTRVDDGTIPIYPG